MSTDHPFPIFVYPTLHCNFSCSYCFNLSGPAEAPDSFVLGFWDKLLAASATLGVPEIRVSGGEPLLISDIEQRCQAIIDRGMRYTLLTNGSLLDRHLRWLTEAPPETLWISYHREFSSVKTFARRVAQAADALPRIGVHVFSCDVQREPNLVRRAVQAGAQRIKILSLTPIGRCADAGKAGVWTAADIEAMVQQWKEPSHRTLEVRLAAPTWIDSPVGAATCVLRERPLLSINHDGSVYPCCVTLGNRSTAIGNLQGEPLDAIIDRASSASRRLPCGDLLPSLGAGKSGCPLQLMTSPLAGHQ